MRGEMTQLRSELNQSSRQKDALIVQLQQTLVLLTQQQYQRMLKPNELNNQDQFNLIQTLPTINNDNNVNNNVTNDVNNVKQLQSLPTMTNLKQY